MCIRDSVYTGQGRKLYEGDKMRQNDTNRDEWWLNLSHALPQFGKCLFINLLQNYKRNDGSVFYFLDLNNTFYRSSGSR